MTESQMVTSILRKIKEGAHAWKASDRYLAGVPDIVGVRKGRFFGIEAKIDYNSPTPLQVHTLLQIAKHGGYAGVLSYNNKTKRWWLKGKDYGLSEVVVQLFKRIDEGGNDVDC